MSLPTELLSVEEMYLADRLAIDGGVAGSMLMETTTATAASSSIAHFASASGRQVRLLQERNISCDDDG